MPRACALLLLAGIALASVRPRPRVETSRAPRTEELAWGRPISPTRH